MVLCQRCWLGGQCTLPFKLLRRACHARHAKHVLHYVSSYRPLLLTHLLQRLSAKGILRSAAVPKHNFTNVAVTNGQFV